MSNFLRKLVIFEINLVIITMKNMTDTKKPRGTIKTYIDTPITRVVIVYIYELKITKKTKEGSKKVKSCLKIDARIVQCPLQKKYIIAHIENIPQMILNIGVRRIIFLQNRPDILMKHLELLLLLLKIGIEELIMDLKKDLEIFLRAIMITGNEIRLILYFIDLLGIIL